MVLATGLSTGLSRLLIMTLAAVTVMLGGLTASVDEPLRDAFLRLLADPAPEARLAVVDIDEQSLAELGPWPWSRNRIAELVEVLIGDYQARGVALDIVFPEPADSEGDQRLQALAVFAPFTLAQILDYRSQLAPLGVGRVSKGQQEPPPLPAAIALGHVANHAGLAAARCVGNIGYSPDADGVLRRLPLVTHYENSYHLHFSLALLTCAGAPQHQPERILAALGGLDGSGRWRIPYRSALEAFTVISAAELLAGTVPSDRVRDRYVLVGSSALSLGDRVTTPLSPLTAGVLVHAAALAALLDQAEGVTRVNPLASPLLYGWVLLTITLLVWWFRRLPAWVSVTALAAVMLVWLLIAGWVARAGVEFPLGAPLLAYLLLLATAVPYEWWLTQRRNRRLVSTLSHYVAEPVLDEILRQGLPHGLEPVLCDVTVLIADMENYTTTTSSLPLSEAAQLTKAFLECLTRPVLAASGTLDKYTGDGLVAFWGAPLPCMDQADRAAGAALKILAAVAELNEQRARRGYPPVTARIGIESGRALVGDLGTPFRSTYTAVGDCINHASRLESAARGLPANLVIGRNAVERLTNHRATPLGTIILRGTGKSVKVFTLADANGRPMAAVLRAGGPAASAADPAWV